MTYQVPDGTTWPRRWPPIQNDVDLAVVVKAMAVLADCGCSGNCRCPIPQAYREAAQVVDAYHRETTRKVMDKLRAFRDNPANDYQARAEFLAELVQVIGWGKP